jgi:hypothetical protein
MDDTEMEEAAENALDRLVTTLETDYAEVSGVAAPLAWFMTQDSAFGVPISMGALLSLSEEAQEDVFILLRFLRIKRQQPGGYFTPHDIADLLPEGRGRVHACLKAAGWTDKQGWISRPWCG